MTSPSIYEEIEKLFKQIDEQVEEADVEDDDAIEVLEKLTKEGGGIEVIGDNFHPKYEDVNFIKRKMKDEYDAAVGLDGSTTKDLAFNNGLIISVGVATCGITGTDDIGEISERGTVSVLSYFDDYELDIKPESNDENTKVHFNQYPRPDVINTELSSWINSIARNHAEGTHFEWISNDINDPLFIDGPLMPTDILTWVLYDQMGDAEHTPMNDWDGMIQQILQSYINGIENCVKSNTPVFGVQKTTNATRVIDAIIKKDDSITDGDIPWSNDAVLFNSALDLSEENASSTICYTPWYIEHEVDIGGRHGLVEPLKDYDEIDLTLGDYEDYKRAFFYAKPPSQTTVYRIGVPNIMFKSNYTMEELQMIALNEMIKQFSEPLPIVVADEKVRIPRELRDRFRRLITAESHIGRNEQRGYDG